MIRVSGPPLVSSLSLTGFYSISELKHDGLIHVGGTHEEAGFDDQPTEEGRDYIMSGMLTMVPSLVKAELVRPTACLRPLSVDEMPIIGEVPGWDNVYLATGHGTEGISLSTVTARIMTDLIVKGQTSISIEPFALDRFLSGKGR